MGKIFASKWEKWENFDAKTGVIFGGKKGGGGGVCFSFMKSYKMIEKKQIKNLIKT
jgi:hypothetical protein